MLQIEIGLWSGNSRKMEIAESFQQPLLTVKPTLIKQERHNFLTEIDDTAGRQIPTF